MSFDELRALLVVVEEGSFLSAAATLNVSRSTLRRQVDALEARVGVPLLQRDRKGVRPTEAGRQLVRGGRVMEQDFSALVKSVRETGRRPSGTVRVTLPVGMPPTMLAMLLAFFRASWPDVRVRTRLHESPLQSNLSSTDVVVWFGAAMPVGAWEVHSIFPARQRLIASRAYLEAHGVPRTIDDLARHDLFAWMSPDENEPRLVTLSGDALAIDPTLTSTDAHLLHLCAQLGQGIAWVPDARLPTMPGDEVLEPVLDALVGRDILFRLAVPRVLADMPKVRLFIDQLGSMRTLLLGAPAAAAFQTT